MAAKERPVLGITMGDAAGIGPEVCAKALASKEIYDLSRPFIIGSSYSMKDAIKFTHKPLKIHEIEKVSDMLGQYGTIDVMDMHNIDPKISLPAR